MLTVLTLLFASMTAAPAHAATPGTTWTQLSPATSPSARQDAAMAYDPATAQMILFGGSASSASSGGLAETWNWTGTTWTQLSPTASPPARTWATLAYDPSTHQMVLFGGINTGGTLLNDTWTWNGTTWTQLTPSTSPPARYEQSMAWDPAAGQLILFGGINNSNTAMSDTWSWTGTNWVQLSPSASPTARGNDSLSYDPNSGGLILYAGVNNSNTLVNDTWLWNGTTWTHLTPGTNPAARYRHFSVYDPSLGLTVMYGGGTSYTNAFAWNGSNWSTIASSAKPSTGRTDSVAAFDPRTGQVVMFGGQTSATVGDTWTFGQDPTTALTWSRAATTGPAGRAGSAMAYDPATGQLLLFGGYRGSGATTLLGDTWAWNGSAWSDVTPSSGSPAARRNATMSFDPATGQLLLFGGTGNSGTLNDTWAWTFSSGSGTWTNVTPANSSASPTARTGASTGFDAATGQLLLFGGTSGASYYSDTWSWTGTAWTQLASSTNPGGRSYASIVFDDSTGQMILQGGVKTGNAQQTDTWVWNGTTNWAAISNAGAPAIGTAKAFSPTVGSVVLWDHLNGATWSWSGTAWSLVTTSAAPPTFTGNGTSPVDGDVSAAFDDSTGQLVVYGGWTSPTTYGTDTWILGQGPEALTNPTATTSTVLNGYDQTIASTQTIQINQPATTGWTISIAADHAPTSSTGTLPPLIVTGATAASPTSSLAPTASCVTGACTAPTGNTVSYPLIVPSTGTAALYSAAATTGTGRTGIPVKIWSTIPANTSPGTYTSTVTVTVNAGTVSRRPERWIASA